MNDVKEFLESAKDAFLHRKDLEDRVRQLDLRCRKVTASMSGMPGGGGGDESKDMPLALLADARDKLTQSIVAETVRLQMIDDFIATLPGRAEYKAILRRRYLHYEDWNTVLRWMRRYNFYYSRRSITRMHGEALKVAREVWSQRGGNTDAEED